MWFEATIGILLMLIFIAVCVCASMLEDLKYKFLRFDYTPSPSFTKKQAEAVYICDRKACMDCSFPSCKYTKDVKHAVNFVGVDNNRYMEDWKNAPSDKFSI